MVKNYTTFLNKEQSWDYFPNAKEVKESGNPKILITFTFEDRMVKRITRWHYLSESSKKEAIEKAFGIFPFKQDVLKISIREYEENRRD